MSHLSITAVVPSISLFEDTHHCSLNQPLLSRVITVMGGYDEFLEQYEALAANGVDFDTKNFEDTAKMTAFYEANRADILVWATKRGIDEGYQNGYQWLDDVDNMYSGYDDYEIHEGLHNPRSEAYDDVVKTLMMEVGHSLCSEYQAYVNECQELTAEQEAA